MSEVQPGAAAAPNAALPNGGDAQAVASAEVQSYLTARRELIDDERSRRFDAARTARLTPTEIKANALMANLRQQHLTALYADHAGEKRRLPSPRGQFNGYGEHDLFRGMGFYPALRTGMMRDSDLRRKMQRVRVMWCASTACQRQLTRDV